MYKNNNSSKPKANQEEMNNAIECKRIMTDEIISAIRSFEINQRDKIKKKNQDALQKYTTESETNYNEFKKIVESLQKEVTEYALCINDCTKIDNKLRAYGDELQKQSTQYLLKLKQIIGSKNVNLLVNKFVSDRHILIIQRITKSKKDIDALMKAGCCGGSPQKKLLAIDIPEIFYNSLHFMELLSQTQVCSPKVEYPQLESDFEGLQRQIKDWIDQYFPTDKDIQFIEKEVVKIKEITKEVPVTKTEIVYKDIPKQDDFLGIGHEYVYGIGTPQQVKRGLDLYEREASNNNTKAYNSLGQVYYEGKVVEQDLKRAYDYYQKSANQGDLEGYYRIGQFYEKGYINKVLNSSYSSDDLIRKAIEFYNKAAQRLSKDLIHQDAVVDLGFIYENGMRDSKGNYIIVQSYPEAKKLYESVDDQNCPRALNNLGTIALKNRNEKSALFYFEKADKMGYASATMNLGICCLKGIGVKQDIYKAMELLKKAAKKGNQESKLQYCYYLLQQASDQNNEQEYFQAATYLREILTVDPENAEALLYLGFLHELGLGVVADFKTSLKYYFQAAKYDNDKALTKIGDIYFSGSLLSRDVEKAMEYYNKAASYGNTTAMINLGAIYEEGFDGQEPNYDKAYEYYLQAANGGSAEAWTHIGLMIEMGRKKDCEVSEGYQAYLKASNMGSLNSLQILKDKIDVLQNYDVNIQFKDDQEEEQFNILKQNQLKILQSHRQVSEIQLQNKLKASQIQDNYDTPTAAGVKYQNWENQNLTKKSQY